MNATNSPFYGTISGFIKIFKWVLVLAIEASDGILIHDRVADLNLNVWSPKGSAAYLQQIKTSKTKT